jgi:hypothetical protein
MNVALSQIHFSSKCVLGQVRSGHLIKLITSYLSHRKFRVSVEGELSTPRNIEAGVPQGSILAPTLYSLYIKDIPQTPGVQLALFADDTCMNVTERKEGYVLIKLQCGLTAIEAWCERWNIKINEDKTQAIYFSHIRAPVRTHTERTEHSLL